MDNVSSLARYQAILAARQGEVRERMAQIFPNGGGEFVWEVGSGHGHFLTAYAAAHPELVCIGVDLESDRVSRAEKKKSRANLSNLHFLQSEAALFMDTLPSTIQIRDAFILFPDPWPKLRHHKHRILQDAFLKRLAARSLDSAHLYFRTDYEPYFQEARATIDGSADWQVANSPWPFEAATVFQSRAAQHYSLVARRRISTPLATQDPSTAELIVVR